MKTVESVAPNSPPHVRWAKRVDPFWLLAAIVLASLPWLVHPYYEATDETNDASIYILTAKALIAGDGYSYLGAPFTIRPPGFSALIAPVIAVRGLDFHALNLFVGAFGAVAVLCLFQLVKPRIGPRLALAVALAVWFNPGFRHMSNQVMSDVPGTALLLACLLLARWADRSPSAVRDVALGVAIGLSAYVRSINVLLALAIVAERGFRALRRPRGRRWSKDTLRGVLLPALCTAATIAPWSVRDALHRPAPPVDQTYLHSYSTAMWHVDGGDPSSPRSTASEISGRVPTRAVQVASAIGSRMGARGAGAIELALGFALLLSLAIVMAVERRATEIFACGAVALLLVYFAFRDRLALPVYLLALPAAVELATRIVARRIGQRASGWIAACALLAIAAFDFRPRAGWREIAEAHRANAATFASAAERLSKDARVAAPIGWHYSVYLDRPVYSLFFATRRKGGMQGAEEVIDKYGIDTVMLADFAPADGAVMPYFAERYGVREQVGPVAIIRVRD